MTSTWATWLKRELAKRRWKQRDLADRSGGTISTYQVSRWISGNVTPTRESVEAVAATLNADMSAALIAAGHEAEPELASIALTDATDAQLLTELLRRVNSGNPRLLTLAASNEPFVWDGVPAPLGQDIN